MGGGRSHRVLGPKLWFELQPETYGESLNNFKHEDKIVTFAP